MGERVLVIGSNSFSGSHFVDHCLDQGCETVGISRSPEPSPVFLPYRRRGKISFQFHQLDLNHDLDKIMAVIDDFAPDYVVNFAAQGMVAESWLHPEHWYETNIVAAVRLHDRLRHCRFLKKYVHVSTPEVYGNCKGLTQESAVYEPSTPYAVSRAAADMSLMAFHRAYGFPVVFTRAANVYGPGQQLYRIIPRAIMCFLSGGKLQLHGGGRSVRSFIHIRDVADATLSIARQGRAGEIFHLSTAETVSIRALVEMIADRLGVCFADFVEMADDRLGKDNAYLLDSAKAQKELGWSATTSLERGIDETIAWARENYDFLLKQPQEYIHKP